MIVDEQHRFGVHQRLALTAKSGPGQGKPHQLVMTATPIPARLSMVAYADLDCSIIDELPPGRQAVSTVLIDNNRRDQVVARVAAACSEGRQAYWVCTLIEESDALQAQAAEATAAELQLGPARPGDRPDSRPHETGRQGCGYERIQGRRHCPAGRHHRYRSGGGCAQRQPDDH